MAAIYSVFHAKPAFSYRKFWAPGPPISKFSTPLQSKWAPIYVIKTFSSFRSGCLLQMMHVFQFQKWIRELFLIFGRVRFFMLHITQPQWMLLVKVLLLNPILIMNSDCFCPYTSKKSVLHCEMAGSVMESEASELKWWLPFWGCIPSTWQQNRNVCIARHSHDLYFQCLNCLFLWKAIV